MAKKKQHKAPAKAPHIRPAPVDSVELARPDPDAPPFEGTAARPSVYSEWLNSPPPEVPAWLTGATDHSTAAIPAPPASARKPAAGRGAGAARGEDDPSQPRGVTASRDLGTSPESPALPRARTRRSTAARRLTAAERKAVESLASGSVAPAPQSPPARMPPAGRAQAAQPPTPPLRGAPPVDQQRRAPARSARNAAPGSMPHPMPALTTMAAMAAPAGTPMGARHTSAARVPTAVASRRTAPALPDLDVSGIARGIEPAASFARPRSPDAWLSDPASYPLTPREPAPAQPAHTATILMESDAPEHDAMEMSGPLFSTARPAPMPRMRTEPGSVHSGAEARISRPPATLGQTASRVAIPRSTTSNRLPARVGATAGRLSAVRASQPVELAPAPTQPPGPSVLIHGPRHPQPTSPVVPRRKQPHSVLAQVVVAVVAVTVLLGALSITSPLGYGAALTGTFQSYAKSVAWVPTATPTATPKPPVFVSSSGGGSVAPPSPAQQVVINEIVAVFGSNANNALAIARCESGFDASARNPYPVGNSHAEGVFQILFPDTWNTTSYSGDNPYDYVANIHAAFQIFQRDGYSWREWQCQP